MEKLTQVPYDPFTSIPEILVKMVLFIQDNATEKGLFVNSGTISVIQSVRSVLDDNIPFEENTDVYSVCSVLIEFLELAPEPLLPISLLGNLYKIEQQKVDLFKGIRKINNQALLFLFRFIGKLLSERESNELNEVTLSIFFFEALTHSKESNIEREDLNQLRQFLSILIDEYK